jgi:hypothetical protein
MTFNISGRSKGVGKLSIGAGLSEVNAYYQVMQVEVLSIRLINSNAHQLSPALIWTEQEPPILKPCHI